MISSGDLSAERQFLKGTYLVALPPDIWRLTHRYSSGQSARERAYFAGKFGYYSDWQDSFQHGFPVSLGCLLSPLFAGYCLCWLQHLRQAETLGLRIVYSLCFLPGSFLVAVSLLLHLYIYLRMAVYRRKFQLSGKW